MTRIEKSIEIDRPPEQVFEVMCDLDQIPQWATVAGAFEGAPQRPLAAGDTFIHAMRVGGMELKGEWKVVELERPSYVVYEASPEAGGWMKMRQTVALSDAGSKVELQIDYELPGGIFGEVADRLFVERRNEREAEASLQNLKSLVETRS